MVLVAVLVLAALALRPEPGVERACGLLFAPARWLGELVRPLSWLSVGTVRAALTDADGAFERERAAALALIGAQVEAALPDEPALRAGRGFLVAEVLERDPKDRDLVRVRFPADAGVEPDLPVVCGDTYVGRVRSVDREHPGEGVVQLVTDDSLRVGAAVDGPEPVELVVGGVVDLRQRGSGLLRLGAEHPSRRVTAGDVRVLEPGDTPRARRRAWADGFRLGRLATSEQRGSEVLSVETSFDYAFGLSQVAIVGGPELATAGPLLADDAFDERAWVTARARFAGDATPGRATRQLALPSGARVEPGAALSLGARFVGRVLDVRGGTAVAALLGDPGLTVSAVALVEGAREPLHLGRLVSVGAGSDGAVRCTWLARPTPPDSPARPHGRARIATSSGERGVPSGLWIGTTELPDGPGVHELRITPVQDASNLTRFRVRLAPAAGEGGA